jgi:hypothetical protein
MTLPLTCEFAVRTLVAAERTTAIAADHPYRIGGTT